MKKKFQVVFTSFLGIVIGMGLTIGLGAYRISQAAPNYEYLDLFTKVLHFVQTSYVEEVDTKKKPTMEANSCVGVSCWNYSVMLLPNC